MTPIDAISPEYLITATLVVLAPGTGVIYTVSTGVFRGARASIAAATGCTLGIVPHLAASILGLAALLHASALAFQVLKLLGIAYLLYLAWGMVRSGGTMELDGSTKQSSSLVRVAARGSLINILNPKLSIFFLAFLPQFIPAGIAYPLPYTLVLSGLFMGLTLAVFIVYGLLANAVRHHVLQSETVTRWMQRGFAAAFAGFAARLAIADRS